jgi:hypothetical protein
MMASIRPQARTGLGLSSIAPCAGSPPSLAYAARAAVQEKCRERAYTHPMSKKEERPTLVVLSHLMKALRTCVTAVRGRADQKTNERDVLIVKAGRFRVWYILPRHGVVFRDGMRTLR